MKKFISTAAAICCVISSQLTCMSDNLYPAYNHSLADRVASTKALFDGTALEEYAVHIAVLSPDPVQVYTFAQIESGCGTSYAAKNLHNFFGIMGKNGLYHFSADVDNIEYFIKLMKYYTQQGLTMAQITEIYCDSSYIYMYDEIYADAQVKYNDRA